MASRGTYAKTRATQEQILSAALDAVAQDGYGAATLQRISDAVGMSKPGLLHHFGSREELLTAILERRDEVDTAAIDELDPVAGFVDLVHHNSRVPGLVALYSAITGVGAGEAEASVARAFTRRHYAGIVVLLTDAVRARQHSGRMSTRADPADVARLLVASADGLQLQWLIDPSVDMTRHLELLVSVFDEPRGRA